MKCPKDADNWKSKDLDKGGCQSRSIHRYCYCTRDLNHKGAHHHHSKIAGRCADIWTTEEMIIEAL